MTELAVSVGQLARFCHRSGDIDYRFGPSPTGEQGVEGHQRLYRRRPESYQAERAVEEVFTARGLSLRVRGRADGWDPHTATLEEIKTCRVDPGRIPAAVSRMHLAQGRLYAALVARELGLAQITVRLCWYFLDRDEEHPLEQSYTATELDDFLQQTLDTYAHWLDLLQVSRRKRDVSLSQLPFPHGAFRDGQRQMAELVYKCADQAGQLLVEAPTGIGKTAAVLYPALRALGAGKHDGLLFCTAKTVGRHAAEQTLALLRGAGMHAVSLTLTAKERICFSPGMACRGEECPFAQDFYQRLPAAREDALAAASLTRDAIEDIARRHTVCPYYLSLEMAPWADLIVCDFHYVYGLTASLAGLAESESGRWSVLVDEAHNLPSRARDMYSASLAKRDLMAARRQAPTPVRRMLDRVNRQLLALQGDSWSEPDYHCLESLPQDLAAAMSVFTGAFNDALVADPGLAGRAPELVSFYFQALQFLRVCECWGEDYRLQMTRDSSRQSLVLRLNCLDPGRLLQLRQAAWHSVVVFSATLSPLAWIRNGLGLEDTAVARRLDSPFAAAQLQVAVNSSIDTRWRQRATTLPALAATIGEWLEQVPGNCLVYFPSYRYMKDCLELLAPDQQLPGGRRLWLQRSDQDATERDQLLDNLVSHRDVAAFCILGGVFGEGIDLPGEQLASVVVVGVGMPQVDRESRLLQAYNEQRYRAGFDFSFRYPGLQKVNQALGRVIRTDRDRGRALLIDRRYAEASYRDLLAPWWDYREVLPLPPDDAVGSAAGQ